LQAITKRLKRGKRGISTVIVVMLSLVLIVIIVSNVVLWSYQMNQLDWEKMQEHITIVNTSLTSETLSFNPSQYILKGSTSLLSGNLANLLSDDGVYMSFRSAYSGTGTSDFVDNNISNVDSSANKGTQSNFTAQKYGPDLIFDKLTETNTGGLLNSTLINGESFEGIWPPTGWSATGEWNKENNQAYSGIYSADFDGGYSLSGYVATPNLNCANATAIYVDFWYRDGGCESNEFLLQYYDGTTWDTIYDLGATSSENQWLHYQERVTDSQYFKSTFKIRLYTSTNSATDVAYVDLMTVKKEADTTNYELDTEVQWTNADYDQINEELAIYANLESNTHSLDTTNGYMIIGGNPNWGSVTGTISFWIKWDTIGNRPWGQHENMEARFSGANLVLDWGSSSALTSSTSFIAGEWYFIAIVWNENTDKLSLYVGDTSNQPTLDAYDNAWFSAVSTVGVTQNNFMASKGGVDPTDGRADDLRYWNVDRSLAEIQNDYNTQLTGSETNLRSYFKLNNNFDDVGPANSDGSGSGSYSFQTDTPFNSLPTEAIRVDVWTGSVWQNVFTNLANGWNNVSVSSYLTSQTFTIRFKGGTETNDVVQDRWNIDVALLHAWSDEYIAEVEFIGSSNTENWNQLNWTVNSAWNTSSVNVTVQLYNYALGGYSTSGSGYIAYTSDSTPNTEESKSQTIDTTPTDFRNATGYWKIKVKGVKANAAPFDLSVDLIGFSAGTDDEGTLLTFKNEGSLTLHIVSLWINNSTQHQRRDVNIFINSGETAPFPYSTVMLPDKPYTVKVITERGNTAVLAID
jgi:hypothetical protein